MKHEDLNRLYNDSEGKLGEIFAEQRSNLLLVHGMHYTRKNSRFWRTLRQTENLSKTQKLRLTKNHLQRITKQYVNNIVTHSPGVAIFPRNENEVQDRKAAELNNSVWEDIKIKKNYAERVQEWASDFVDIGEAWLKIFYDQQAGKYLEGYEEATDENGSVVMDQDGTPMARPAFSGDLVWERVHGFNMLTDPDANSWPEARWCCLRKMVPVKNLRARYRSDPDKLAIIRESAKRTYRVFDVNTGAYFDGRGLTMIREFYFRSSPDAPLGYYYIATEDGILHQGAIPGGVWPILKCGFDDLATSARSYSIIKQLRPYQAEVNRASSKVAEHQITVGDDKIITAQGASITPGGTAHGIKHVKVNGPPPTILPGRSGNQYFEYIQMQIDEMYQVSGLMEDREKAPAQIDPHAQLFRSLTEKKNFVLYSSKFERFLKSVCETSLRLKKMYCRPDELVPVIGRHEAVNMPEFKSSEDISYQIKLEAQSDDIETKLGRHLTMMHILQYVGQNLDPEDAGKLIRAMPYVNSEELLGDLTLDYDNATNDILALDRGEQVFAEEGENHSYMIKKITNRMKQSDFPLLAPEIQQNYAAKRDQHRQLFEREQQAAQAANSGYIPSGGRAVKADIYVQPDPNKEPKRAVIPYEALDWLLKRLEEQGSKQQELQQMAPEDQAALGQLQMAEPAGQQYPA